VVFTDRSLNHMAPPFVSVMQDLNVILKKTYNADKTVLIPGSGTYAMEAVARQFLPPTASNNHCRRSDTNKPIVLRNGWFSFRWSEIFETMGIGEADHTVLKAEPDQSGNPQYQPHNVDAVVAEILKSKPPVVFAPHVETSIGIILPDDYIRKVGAACQEAGALFVLDGIASGTVWVDMKDLNVDVFISAPQKGWSGPAAVGIAMLSDRAHARMMEGPESSSYTVNLKRWSGIMDLYDGGGFGYHCTMPTDAIRQFRDIAQKQVDIGLDKLKQAQIEMGEKARKMLESKGLKSAAADGAAAPGVLVYYSPGVSNPEMVGSFREHGMQVSLRHARTNTLTSCVNEGDGGVNKLRREPVVRATRLNSRSSCANKCAKNRSFAGHSAPPTPVSTTFTTLFALRHCALTNHSTLSFLCRSPPACPGSSTSPPACRRSASGCSGSTSSAASTRPWPRSRPASISS